MFPGSISSSFSACCILVRAILANAPAAPPFARALPAPSPRAAACPPPPPGGDGGGQGWGVKGWRWTGVVGRPLRVRREKPRLGPPKGLAGRALRSEPHLIIIYTFLYLKYTYYLASWFLSWILNTLIKAGIRTQVTVFISHNPEILVLSLCFHMTVTGTFKQMLSFHTLLFIYLKTHQRPFHIRTGKYCPNFSLKTLIGFHLVDSCNQILLFIYWRFLCTLLLLQMMLQEIFLYIITLHFSLEILGLTVHLLKWEAIVSNEGPITQW